MDVSHAQTIHHVELWQIPKLFKSRNSTCFSFSSKWIVFIYAWLSFLHGCASCNRGRAGGLDISKWCMRETTTTDNLHFGLFYGLTVSSVDNAFSVKMSKNPRLVSACEWVCTCVESSMQWSDDHHLLLLVVTVVIIVDTGDNNNNNGRQHRQTNVPRLALIDRQLMGQHKARKYEQSLSFVFDLDPAQWAGSSILLQWCVCVCDMCEYGVGVELSRMTNVCIWN